MSEFRLHFTQLPFREPGRGNVHDRADKPPYGGVIPYRMCHDVKMLDRAARHQQSMLVVEILPGLCCLIDHLPDERNVVWMRARECHFDRRRGFAVVLEDPEALIGPEDFSTRDVPAKTAGEAQCLCFRQVLCLVSA